MSSRREREPRPQLGDHRRIGVRLHLEADDRLEAPLLQLALDKRPLAQAVRRRRARPRRRGRPGTGSRSRSPSPGRACARSRRSPRRGRRRRARARATPARTRSHCGSSLRHLDPDEHRLARSPGRSSRNAHEVERFDTYGNGCAASRLSGVSTGEISVSKTAETSSRCSAVRSSQASEVDAVLGQPRAAARRGSSAACCSSIAMIIARAPAEAARGAPGRRGSRRPAPGRMSAIRFMKNSSRLDEKIARNFTRSSSGVRSSSASCSTRRLNSSQLRSRSIHARRISRGPSEVSPASRVPGLVRGVALIALSVDVDGATGCLADA